MDLTFSVCGVFANHDKFLILPFILGEIKKIHPLFLFKSHKNIVLFPRCIFYQKYPVTSGKEKENNGDFHDFFLSSTKSVYCENAIWMRIWALFFSATGRRRPSNLN